MEVVIEKMNHQAMGIAKINGKVVFIPKVIVGDIVDIDIVKEYKNYNIGRVNKIIKKGSKRVDALCPYYDICGGCSISAYTYEDELAVELMNYARDFDPYEYKDIYSNDEDAFNDMKHNLLTSKDTSNMIDWLSNDINIMATEKDLSDKNMSDLSKQAFNLINKLNQHLKVLEKEETKEVDL